MNANQRLDSWKEIAAYLHRGARTVQRWEREEGLPVHRLQHEKLGSVYAYPQELDAWWERRRGRAELHPAPEAVRTVAVLPFSDLSREKDQEYFCDGIAEEIAGALARIQGMRVVSRTSSRRFKGAELAVQEIARRLGATAILEGSVRRADGRVRVTVQLTDAGKGYTLWSDTCDRDISDVFAIQEEIARKVARALEVTLSPRESAALGKVPTRKIQAYDCYLRGRAFYYRYGPRDIDCAIQLFMRAVRIDPAYPPAYAGLADCWSFLYLYSERNDLLREQAAWAGSRAVELDPESAQAQASRALALSLDRRDEEAAQGFEAAIRLDPNLFEAHYFYARHLFACGQLEKAVESYENAIRTSPDDYQSPLLMAQIYDDLGRAADARAARLRGIELAGRRLNLYPDDVRAVYMAANGMAALGQRERALEWVGRALAMRPADSMLLYNAGCIYSLLGSVEPALTSLEQAVRLGLRQKGWFEHDSNLEPLRTHPRFVQLLRDLD